MLQNLMPSSLLGPSLGNQVPKGVGARASAYYQGFTRRQYSGHCCGLRSTLLGSVSRWLLGGERLLAGPQPFLGTGYIIKELKLQHLVGRRWTVERQDIRVRICLHHVGNVAQPQPNGLRKPDLVEPRQRIEPWSSQARVVVEQVEAMKWPDLR
jgi:hypothetical protein